MTPPPYRGSSLGLPEAGPGRLAGFGPRFVAICIDWALCWIIAYGLFDIGLGASGLASFVPLGIFFLENLLLVSTVGTTLGHRLIGLRVHRYAAAGPARLLGAPGVARGALRALLVCLALPALVWDQDGRGIHDRLAGTVITRTR